MTLAHQLSPEVDNIFVVQTHMHHGHDGNKHIVNVSQEICQYSNENHIIFHILFTPGDLIELSTMYGII